MPKIFNKNSFSLRKNSLVSNKPYPDHDDFLKRHGRCSAILLGDESQSSITNSNSHGSIQPGMNCTVNQDNNNFNNKNQNHKRSITEKYTKFLPNSNWFRCKQIIWLFLMTGLIVTAVYFTRERIESYFRRDTIIQIKDIHKNELSFPAVTICNFNRIFKRNKNIELFRHLAELSKPNYTTKHSIYDSLNLKQKKIDSSIRGRGNASRLRLSKYLDKYGWKFTEETLISCKFRNWTCSVEDFTKIYTRMGTCYMFNAGSEFTFIDNTFDVGDDMKMNSEADSSPIEHIEAGSQASQQKIDEATSAPKKQIFNAYQSIKREEKVNPKALTQKIPGSNHGLRLVLNAETYKYTENVEPGGYDEAGIRIQVHNMYEPPSVEQLGVGVPTGTKAFLAISKTESENMEPPWGNCNKKWENDTTYGFSFLKFLFNIIKSFYVCLLYVSIKC